MSDFLKAYRARKKRNHDDLIQLIEDVKKKNKDVKAYVHNSDRYIDSVYFVLDESINVIQFNETPYRWSGCGYTDFANSHYGLENCKLPFTADDVLSTFEPIKSKKTEYFKSIDQYLKWYSFLKQYENTKIISR